jgi:hypothetical protein
MPSHKTSATKRSNAQALVDEFTDSHASEFQDEAARRRMIADAAYYRAECRGFEPGHELEDWLAAENEVVRNWLRRTPESD